MATLRATAFILNGVLLLIALFFFVQDAPDSLEEVLISALIFSAPIVNTVAIVMLSRPLKGTPHS